MYSNTIVSLLTPTDAQCMHPFSPFSIRIRTINRQLWSAYVRSGRQMYEWFVSSLKVSVPTVWSGFPGTDVSLGLSCAGLCLLPVRRAACRSTKLKCCDRVPGAVSSDATICATRRSSNGARVSRCSLPTEHATAVKRCRAGTYSL